MISLLHLNKLTKFSFFFIILIFHSAYAENKPEDIWGQQEENIQQINQSDEKKETTIESPILSEDINKITIEIDEEKISKS